MNKKGSIEDTELKSIIPSLTEVEYDQIEKNHLGFVGEKENEKVRIMPTPIGFCYWLWSYIDFKQEKETYSKTPTPISRLPIQKWLNFAFAPKQMKPQWEYPNIHNNKSELNKIIYFIEAIGTGYVKIGIANEYGETRLKQLQTGSPFELQIIKTIPGNKNIENDLHQMFSVNHIRGEWFYMSNKLINYINRIDNENK